jgi:tRNA pseudouridine55 synthase
VRSLAHDIGAALGCGAHLAALRRTGSGRFMLADAVALPAPDADASTLLSALRPLDALLPEWPAAVVTAAGADRVRHGGFLGPDACTVWPEGRSARTGPDEDIDAETGPAGPARPSLRIVDAEGRLLALAAWRGGLLHPSVVLV